MAEAVSASLRGLRDALRDDFPDADSFAAALASTMQDVNRQVTGVTLNDPSRLSDIFRAVERYMPSIQVQLLVRCVPTFLDALASDQKSLLDRMFVPPKAAENLSLRRTTCAITYQNLPSLLNANSVTPLPIQSRKYLLDMLDRLARAYSIDDLYWSIWGQDGAGGDEKETSMRKLKWEEAVKSLMGVPAKVANAVGRWKAERWAGDTPDSLTPRAFFDSVSINLEALMYELAQAAAAKAHAANIRLVLQRMASLGLVRPPKQLRADPNPSFFSAVMPELLLHLHPPVTSPLEPYPQGYFPEVFLSLPTSVLNSYIASLIQHLSVHLIFAETPLRTSSPDPRIRRATEMLRSVLGSAEPGGEAWDGVLQYLIQRKTSSAMAPGDQVQTRIVIAWVGLSGSKASRALINALMDIWTDAKAIRFALYSQQFHLTHAVLLSLSLLPPMDPFLVELSLRPKFIMAVQSYLAHPDGSIRRLGMLTAEIISMLSVEESASDLEFQPGVDAEIEELKAGLEVDEEGNPKSAAGSRTGGPPKGRKRLRFDISIWDGNGDAKEECRWLRTSVGLRDGQMDHGQRELDEDEAWMLGWDRQAAAAASHSTRAENLSREKPRGRSETKAPRHTTAMRKKPIPKIVMLDAGQEDDPLEGYASASPSSSRSASPTPEYLAEVAADPTLALDGAQKKKTTRPVYIGQLLQLLKEREKPESIEMALQWGEGLVRAKRSFGTELVEKAINVAALTIGLDDAFNLDDFETRRQGLVTALVACAPRQVAPFLTEQYFNTQYSLHQESVMLTALAMGARELAGMPTIQSATTTRRIDFPSKTLPAQLHRQYIGPNDQSPLIHGSDRTPDQLEQAIDGVRGLILSHGAEKGVEQFPELRREKRLRLGSGPSKRGLIAEVGSLSARQADEEAALAAQAAHAPIVPFSQVAAEYFIMPLINRFWQHFHDTNVRQARALASNGRGSRLGASGAGMVLSPMGLEKLLMTLALLLHAARLSSAFLAVLCPEALELAMTIGVRHPSRPEDHFIPPSEDPTDQGGVTESQVLGAALELALVCLDGAVDLDSGRTLATDQSELVLALGEWASKVFDAETKGGKVAAGQGGHGGREGRIRANAAGVLLKVADMGEKWGHLGLSRM